MGRCGVCHCIAALFSARHGRWLLCEIADVSLCLQVQLLGEILRQGL